MKSFIVLLFFSSLVLANDTTRSAVFKPKPQESLLIRVARPSDVTYQLWEGFTLVRNANSGDPAAMLELAIRYLNGDGFIADSVKAFQLVQRAAEKEYLLAYFNLGVFYHNGWGVEWNPFKAYKNFQYAAQKGLREGSFAYGLYLTDNLTTQRNWSEAYQWIKKSADKGYGPAKEVLPELEKFSSMEKTDSTAPIQSTVPQSDSITFEPMLLDFTSNQYINTDSPSEIDSSFSLIEVLRSLGVSWKKKIDGLSIKNDSNLFTLLQSHAEWGVPEEFTILGRCYENGIGIKQDSLKAMLNYLRAVRLESNRAPSLLIRLISDGNLITKTNQYASQGKPEAMYAISCFALTEIIPAQQKNDIANFLLRSSEQRYIPSMIELGTAYFNGQIVPQQRERTIDLWTRAITLGSNEALVRLASVKLLTNYGEMPRDSAMKIIRMAIEDGSLLAQVTLGYCSEKGIGVSKNVAEAVRYYRTAAYRGSRNAYSSLKKLYDELRPPDKEFQITEKDY